MQTFNIGKINIRILPDQIVFELEAEPNQAISNSSVQLPAVVGFLRSFHSNRHRFFRIPVKNQKLKANVKCGNRVFHVNPIDLSRTGILIASSQ